MANSDYNPNARRDAYETELNRLIAELGPMRAFTDEENIYMAKHGSEVLNKFLLQQRNIDCAAALELKTIDINA